MSLIAVIDTETTGFNFAGTDRVLEVAAVLMTIDGEIVREFDSLINPGRDLGPTRVHRITSAEVVQAPQFHELLGSLLDALDGTVAIAGHNVRFDQSFLNAEFKRCGTSFPEIPSLCTMTLAGGGNLQACCSAYSVNFDGDAHSALHDARAAARLLQRILSDDPLKRTQVSGYSTIVWPRILQTEKCRCVTRGEARHQQTEPPAFLQKLLARSRDTFSPDADNSALLAYTALLERALEDRVLDENEGRSLFTIAEQWNIDGSSISRLHHQFLGHLVAHALSDGVISNAERNDLQCVAKLLHVDQTSLNDLLEGTRSKLADFVKQPDSDQIAPPEGLRGLKVCFTGELSCTMKGTPISRESAAEVASKAGLTVVDSVTKKLDVLVVADPLTQSGKAKKARQYGCRIIHEPVFWKAIGIEVD